MFSKRLLMLSLSSVLLLSACGSNSAQQSLPQADRKSTDAKLVKTSSEETNNPEEGDVTRAIKWEDCADQKELKCGHALIPVSYENTKGPFFIVPVVMRPAKTDVPSKGTIAFRYEYGGFENLEYFKKSYKEHYSFPEDYNVFAFGFPGDGNSGKFPTCFDTVEEEDKFIEDNKIGNGHFPYKDDLANPDAHIDAFYDSHKIFARRCAKDAKTFGRMTTYNLARDMYTIAKAIENKKDAIFNIYAVHQASVVAEAAINMFPDKMGLVVTVGNKRLRQYIGVEGDPKAPHSVRTGGLEARQRAFEYFKKSCKDAKERCVLNSLVDPKDPKSTVDSIIENVLNKLKAKDEVIVIDAKGKETAYSYDLFVFGTIWSLGNNVWHPSYKKLAQSFYDLAKKLRDPNYISSVTNDVQQGYSEVGQLRGNYLSEGSFYVQCSETAVAKDAAEMKGVVEEVEKQYPHFGSAYAFYQGSCFNFKNFIPALGPKVPTEFPQHTTAKVLAFGTRYSPFYNYEDSESFAKDYGGRAIIYEAAEFSVHGAQSQCYKDAVLLFFKDPDAEFKDPAAQSKNTCTEPKYKNPFDL